MQLVQERVFFRRRREGSLGVSVCVAKVVRQFEVESDATNECANNDNNCVLGLNLSYMTNT